MKQRVKDVMNRQIIAVLPGDTVEETARVMREHNIGIVPVVSAGSVRGILTDRDIVLNCVAEGSNPKRVKVSDIMTQGVTSVTPDQTIEQAFRIMQTEQIKRLPVLNDGAIDGILSITDILREDINPKCNR